MLIGGDAAPSCGHSQEDPCPRFRLSVDEQPAEVDAIVEFYSGMAEWRSRGLGVHPGVMAMADAELAATTAGMSAHDRAFLLWGARRFHSAVLEFTREPEADD